MMARWMTCAGLALLGIAVACGSTDTRAALDEPPPTLEGLREGGCVLPAQEQPVGPTWVTAVEPKPISDSVRKGLGWLLATQLASGGWGQGERARQTAVIRTADVTYGSLPLPDPDGEQANVADTCISILALLRASPSPSEGPYAQAIARGVAYVCGEVEASDEESLHVTSVRGTRVQAKIGTYVDTFFASMVLSELKGRSGSEALDGRVARALDKVVDKIERNQQSNGAFEGQGWAPVLSQAMAGKALNRAIQAGTRVDAETLTKNTGYFMTVAASDAPSADSAGVALYSSSAGLAGLQESANTGFMREKELKDLMQATEDEDELAAARAELDGIFAGRRAQEEAQGAMLGRLDDEGFVSGFGSNGGEEFLSYMNISESLVVRADGAWERWDAAMVANLERVQNQDGSWTGHHCITGRNFCTSAALLTLLADRTPVPEELVAAAR